MATSNSRTVGDRKQDFNEDQLMSDLDVEVIKDQLMSDLNVEVIKSDNERGFLDFPLEVRMMLYDIFFGAQVFRIGQPRSESGDPGADESTITRATARHKVSLLLTSRDIWVEASPFFYRLHVFHIRLLDARRFPFAAYSHFSMGVCQVLQAINYVELIYQNPDLDSAEDYNVSAYLRLLRFCGPTLKSLRIELLRFTWSSISDKKGSVSELQHLWPRLDSLQVCIQHEEDELDAMPGGEFIAPGELWRRQVCEKLWEDAAHQGRRRAFKRTVYSVTRHQKADEMG